MAPRILTDDEINELRKYRPKSRVRTNSADHRYCLDINYPDLPFLNRGSYLVERDKV